MTIISRAAPRPHEPKAKQCDAKEKRKEAEKPKAKKKPRSRKDFIGYIDSSHVRNKTWSIAFNVKELITGVELDSLFQEEERRQRRYNHRTFIGPGADMSSEDRIAVELRYKNANDMVTFSSRWIGYVKTVYALYSTGEWVCRGRDIPIELTNSILRNRERPVKSAIFVQPHAGDRRPTAYITLSERPDEPGECKRLEELRKLSEEEEGSRALVTRRRRQAKQQEGISSIPIQLVYLGRKTLFAAFMFAMMIKTSTAVTIGGETEKVKNPVDNIMHGENTSSAAGQQRSLHFGEATITDPDRITAWSHGAVPAHASEAEEEATATKRRPKTTKKPTFIVFWELTLNVKLGNQSRVPKPNSWDMLQKLWKVLGISKPIPS